MNMSTKLKKNDTLGGGVSKVDRYEWLVNDKPGKFAWVPKANLKIDHRYQRDVGDDSQKIKRIAAKWSWAACGALIVAERDGDLFVVDGQHRARAAMKRSDIETLPCLIFASTGRKDEAKSFLQVNKDRKPMTAMQSFKASVIAGEPNALMAEEILTENGLQIGNTRHGFKAVGALMKAARVDHDVLRRVFPLIVQISGGANIHHDILAGIFETERALKTGSLTDKQHSERLLNTGKDQLLRSINDARAFLGVGGDRPRREGILKIVNYRLKNKLELK